MPNMRTVFILSLLQFSVSYMFENNAENTGCFWHITDIHVDQNYSRIGNPHNLCHKEMILYPDNGLYGNFLCDSPEYLVNVTFKAMKKIKPNPDFIIWTGDNLPHTSSFDPDWNIIYKALHNVTVLFDENFHGIPTFPCIGNHDTFPPNMLLPNETSSSVYKNILEKGGWSKFLNDESASTFIKGGYYSQVLKPGLRIISLNTILWYIPNYLTQKMVDPADQFKWFEETLYNSSKTSEKVYIIGHVPPGFYNRVKRGTKGSPTYHFQYLNAYLKVLKKYSAIIAGQLFGHLHMDMFQIFLLGSGQFLSSSLLASSVTPWHFTSKDNISIPVNPSVRLMHYDQRNGLLKDYDQFYLNLTKANKMNIEESANLYELLYTFTKSYNVPDLSTDSLVEVYEKIKRNDTLFDMFFKFSTAGKESVICDTYCKVAQLCSISSTSVDEYNACMKTSGHLNFKCHDVGVNPNIYSNVFAYCIAFVISCLSAFLLYVICQRYKQSRGEIYTKLLRDI